MDHVGKTISIGNFTIAYYGIVVTLGMVAGLLLACRQAKKTGQDPDTYVDLALIDIVCALIGARLYYVVFRWDLYKDDLLSILNIRQGGLAIYGGVIAGVLTTYIFSRVKRIPFGRLADVAGLGLVLGQIIGRWGNFFNREAFGGYTDNLFAMQLPVSAVRASEITEAQWEHTVMLDGITYIQVHPTFLYESLWNLLLLILLLVFFDKRKFEGEVFLWYLLGYGLGRFWIESLRTDQLLLPVIGYPVSRALAAVLVVTAAVWIVCGRLNYNKKRKMTGE
jgi:phosphatidylglycerol:prolipoprotein diacylglycerol transferase